MRDAIYYVSQDLRNQIIIKMKKIGKISIVLPCYKEEACVGNMIADVLAQSYDDLELIVISNGDGQEKQLSVINSYAAKDVRVRVISIPEGGVSNARNVGMKASSGDWLTFVDADDRLAGNHLQLLSAAATDDVDIVCGGIETSMGNSDQTFKPQPLEAGHHLDEYFVRRAGFTTTCSIWNKLYRNSKINTWGGILTPVCLSGRTLCSFSRC